MTILRLDLNAGGWRAVPLRLFEDERLNLDTRGVAGYIATRSDSFRLSVAGLCVLLGLGEERWRRMSRELESAGYLKRSEGKDERGRFRHELLFSPIPTGGFSGKRSGQSTIATPKTLGRPGAGKSGPAHPGPAAPGTTRNPVDQIPEHHHHPDGGGAQEQTDSKPPAIWIVAAEHEMSIEEQVRPIRNRGGLLEKILKRYRANGGPDQAVLAALNAKKDADAEREVREAALREQARQESELAQIEARRHAAAEGKAKAMTSDERLQLLTSLDGKMKQTQIRINAKKVFIERGEIQRGPLCRTLVQLLLPS